MFSRFLLITLFCISSVYAGPAGSKEIGPPTADFSAEEWAAHKIKYNLDEEGQPLRDKKDEDKGKGPHGVAVSGAIKDKK